MRDALLPWQRVEVSGPSMTPTLRHGDVVIVRHGARVRPGDVVLARFRTLPERLVIKRAGQARDGGWWLESDNAFAGGDSAAHGPADVLGRVVVRVRPGTPRLIRRGVRGRLDAAGEPRNT
jgi:phage repressor protein C with HTH and peptisase S24 domain